MYVLQTIIIVFYTIVYIIFNYCVCIFNYVSIILGEVKSSERFPLANKAKKRSELFTSPNIYLI